MEKRSTVNTSVNASELVPSSVRADGSVRKERRIRPGFVAQEQKQRYVTPARKRQEQPTQPKEVAIPVSPPAEPKKKYIPPHRRKEIKNTMPQDSGDQPPDNPVSSTYMADRVIDAEKEKNVPNSSSNKNPTNTNTLGNDADELTDALNQVRL
ncbi:hypothetical protein EV175_002928 [Coemansia sp. RSA 1933]|nr:hypothetical protein EV175_002928 [Coemansia sp. RSA 1933]